jgi:hypothetical protein
MDLEYDDPEYSIRADLHSEYGWPAPQQRVGPINDGTLNMFVGPTGAGKSFFGHALCCAVGSGEPMRHWATTKGKALMVDGEMSGADLKRIQQALGGSSQYSIMSNAMWYEKGYGSIDLTSGESLDKIMPIFRDQDMIVADNVYSLMPTTSELPSTSQEYWLQFAEIFRELKSAGTALVLLDHPAKSKVLYGTASKSWNMDLIGVMQREEGNGFLAGTAGFFLSFKSEDGGKIRGEYNSNDHGTERWSLIQGDWS